VREAIRRLLDKGPSWAVITMGAEGAVVSDGHGFWRITVPKVEVVNAIGSGDAFCAGLAVGLLWGHNVQDAARLGAACGSANATTTMAGFIELEQLAELQQKVGIETW
jgi:fructose-1-phosphate kinase PfkB-like protein